MYIYIYIYATMLKTKEHWLFSHVTVTVFIDLRFSSTLKGLVVSRI